MAPALGAWVVLSTKLGEPRPPLGRSAWDWRPWPAGGDRERTVISWDPRILTLLEVARGCPDLDGNFELESSMGVVLGV